MSKNTCYICGRYVDVLDCGYIGSLDPEETCSPFLEIVNVCHDCVDVFMKKQKETKDETS